MNEPVQNESVKTETQKQDEKFRLRTVVSDEDAMFLRERSEDVTVVVADNSGNASLMPETRELIAALKAYVIQHNGLGMAAPQLGVRQRVFVMRKPWNSNQLVAIINPRIWRTTGKSRKAEGCFSVPTPDGVFAEVERPSMIWVDYTSEDGEFIQEEMLVGMDARVFQHELDHLDGNLMVDEKLPRGSGFTRWVRA